MSKNVVVVGAQWGDEGKGKIVDWLTESVQGVVRFNGGHNAGHTLVINGQKTVLRLIPSGVMHPHVKCYNGAVVSPEAMLKEIDDLKAHGMDAEDRIFVSGQCPLVLPYHIALDHARENALGDKKIGTTGRGIGPAYEDKIARRAVHVRDLAEPKVFAEKVRENCKLINFLLANYYNSEPVDVEKMIEDTLAMAPRIVPKIRDISHILNTKMKELREPCSTSTTELIRSSLPATPLQALPAPDPVSALRNSITSLVSRRLTAHASVQVLSRPNSLMKSARPLLRKEMNSVQ